MLTPSQRKKVAEYCIGGFEWIFNGDPRAIGGSSSELQNDPKLALWNPRSNVHQRDALVYKIAGLIEAMPESDKDYMPDPRKHYDPLLRHAIATGNTHDLESLAYELMEAE